MYICQQDITQFSMARKKHFIQNKEPINKHSFNNENLNKNIISTSGHLKTNQHILQEQLGITPICVCVKTITKQM